MLPNEKVLLLLFCHIFECAFVFVFSHLSIRAVVQSPQVCLLSCELVFADLYVGVPQTGSVTLFNQTLLPAHFNWKKVRKWQFM